MSPHPKTYKAYAWLEKGGKLSPIDVEWKDPKPGEIVVKVLACGVCASDELAKYQILPGTAFPRIPGHEIVGDVAAVPPTEELWKVGQRVGSGWHGGHCHTCARCRSGNFALCANKVANGIGRDGGFAEYVTLRTEAVASVPDDIDPAEAAPLLCAGVTVFASMRRTVANPPDVVAVHGLGGVGHLAVQIVKALGYDPIVLSSSAEKEELAYKLGAKSYLDGSKVSHAEELKKLGGAQLIVCTNPDAKGIQSLQSGLARGGEFLLIAITGMVNMHWGIMVQYQLGVVAGVSGVPKDMEECMAFVKSNDIKVMVDRFPLEKAQEAYDHRSNAKFRSVVVPGLVQ